jgi:hypothetical protein
MQSIFEISELLAKLFEKRLRVSLLNDLPEAKGQHNASGTNCDAQNERLDPFVHARVLPP